MIGPTSAGEAAAADDPNRVGSDRRETTTRKRRHRRRGGFVLAAIVAVLVLPVWSFANAVMVSNGDPFAANATEWARSHSLGGVVDGVERLWYSHHQPATGGTPRSGIAGVAPARAVPSAARAARTVPSPHRSVCPARIPPLASSPLGGEGAWISVGRVPSAVCFAYMRPDAVHTSVLVGLAWMNMNVLSATLHNGTSEPGGGPWRAGPAISSSDYGRVVAAFNSGFRLDASRGGYFTEGRTVRPLVDGRASLVIDAGGQVDVGMWGRDDAFGPKTVSVRQNLSLVVDAGRLVAGLSDANNGQWGATLGNRIYTWRSGVGIDAHHNLIYVGGPGLNVATLAAVLQRAGSVRAMELDINPDWVSLMTYTGTSPNTVTSTKLLANMERTADRYLHANTRDFIELDLRRQQRSAGPSTHTSGNRTSGNRLPLTPRE